MTLVEAKKRFVGSPGITTLKDLLEIQQEEAQKTLNLAQDDHRYHQGRLNVALDLQKLITKAIAR